MGHGHVPEACEGLPDPDRVFVGGGGLAALDLALARLVEDLARAAGRGLVVKDFFADPWDS